jgi:2'-5' RNA ligase
MRLFTALSLDNTQKREIYEWRESQLPGLAPCIPPDNYHVTLAFYGEIKSGQIESLVDRLDESFLKKKPQSIELDLQEVSYWPTKKMLWVRPTSWPKTLDQMAKKHIQVGTQFGAKLSKRDYLPHITIARNLDSAPTKLPEIDLTLRVSKVTLFESIRGNGRMHYHSLIDWQL